VTCDVWQAGNTDAYFAVTGHWIEECASGVWTLEHALLGFTQMNCSHNGTHLGQMLFTILNRLRVVHKVRVSLIQIPNTSRLHSLLSQIGHVTCDNTKNNDTMLDKFAHCYELKTGTSFDVKCQHIR
jgi:hypothetical protein